ncbi:MAG: C25 family cysteine peptidase [bacterium]
MSNKLIGVCLVVGFSFGFGWQGSFHFRPDMFRVERIMQNGRGFSLLSLDKGEGFSRQGLNIGYTGDLGKPILPYCFFTLVIPQGMMVDEVQVQVKDEVKIATEALPFPAQGPVPVSQRDLSGFVEPDPKVYSGTEPWPVRVFNVSPVGIKSGFRLITVSLFPVRYDPSNRCYVVASRLTVRVNYKPDPSAEPISLTDRQIKLFSPAVKLLVINPEDVNRYAPAARITDFGTIDYCIITDSALEGYFQRLINWRERKGYRGVVRTTSWINSNYSGRDLQEKIRNFIRDYFENYGLMWVLLGGDNGVVPCRRARAVVGSYIGNIPCDLYYADLQWSWDSDNDSIFGEYGVDTTDLYYDVFIGRASVDDTNQVKTFVNKVLTHETNPPTDYLRRFLLVDDSLWSGYNHRQSSDSIANITPSGWNDVIIHEPGNTTMVRDSLNHGFQFCHMVGHGNDVGIYHTMPPPTYAFYSNSVISGHNNGSRVGLINSIACYPGNFEYSDCLAESTHNWSNGGALAVIMNSRYGWGTPPVLGPSEKLDIRFYDFFFNHDTMPIGLTHAESKEVYRGLANGSDGAWRWCYFELNYFGDPLLLMYEQLPGQLNATFSSPINADSQDFTVMVNSDTFPVPNALVCVQKGSEVYARNYTNSSGRVTFTIKPTSPGYMYVTATKSNYLPDIDSCQVVRMSPDVGVSRILAPSDTVDSGVTVTPSAMVRNYISVPVANIPVRFTIDGGYSDTVVVTNLGGNDSVRVEFRDWRAQPGGNLAVSCSTMLSSDTNPANDCALETVFVRYRDVGCVQIISPAGDLDSTTSLPVRARVRNFGNTTESFYVHFRITGPTSYNDSAFVNGLGPGDSVVVNFNDWVCGTRGSYSTACSTMLSADMQETNNRTSGNFNLNVHDIAVLGILSPPAQIDSAALVPVQMEVANLGSTQETPLVFVRIGTYYQDSVIASVNAGEVDTVSLPSWYANAPRGALTVFCSTAVNNDVDLGNDTLSRITEVIVHDVAAVAILAPSDTVDSGSVVIPQARLKNLGSVQENFNCQFRISDGYLGQIAVNLPADAESVVSFPSWTARRLGTYITRCTTMLTSDHNPANDRALGTVRVVVTDVGVVEIVAPVGEVEPGSITPVARVGNYSTVPKSFKTYLYIRPDSGGLPVFIDSVLVEDLPNDSIIDVSFSSWDAPRGRFVVRCSTGLGDANPGNDTLSVGCLVVTHDAAMVAILPQGEMRLMTVTPILRIRNLGDVTENGQVFLSIVDTATGNPVYVDSSSVTGLAPAEMREVRLPPWDATVGYFRLSGRVVVGGDINFENDTLSVTLKVWSRGWGWERRRDLAGEPKRVKHGGALTAIESGSGSIYALKGNKSLEFYEYEPSLDEWRQLPALPAPPSGRPVYKSGAMCSDRERYIYATKGNNTLEFWRYDIQNQTWEQLTDIPAGIRTLKKGGTGLAYVRQGDSSFVYCLKGSNTCEFYAYSVERDVWQPRTQAPAEPSGRKFKAGSALCSHGSDRLFAIKSYTNEFYEYIIAEDRWINRMSVPFYSIYGRRSKCKDGCAITSDQSAMLYLLTGGNRDYFYAYSVATDNWFELEPMPLGETGRHVKAGGALVYLEPGVYALRGNATNEFYVYITDTTTLVSSPPERSGVAGGSIQPPILSRLLFAPNPAQQRVKFVYQGWAPAQLTFYSSAGQLMFNATIVPGKEYHLDVSKLPAGVYLARVGSGSEVVTQKLIVQH